MFLYSIIFLCFFVVIGCRIAIGVWSNILMFINILISGLIATALYEAIANMMRESDSRATDAGVASLVEKEIVYADMTPFIMIWLIFISCLLFLRFVTDYISRYKVRFPMALDIPGRIITGIGVGVLFLAFTTFTLHQAPLLENEVGILLKGQRNKIRIKGESSSETFRFELDQAVVTAKVEEGRWLAELEVVGTEWGFQQKANSWNFFFGPDLMWMSYCRYASRYPLSEFRGGLFLPEVTGEEGAKDSRRSIRPFDSRGTLPAKSKLKRVLRKPTSYPTKKETPP